MKVPLITFAAVTIATILAVAWVYVKAAHVVPGENGYMFTVDDSVRAVRPVLAVYATYALWEFGLSVNGLVSVTEALLQLIP